jgi:hypothetical protein
VIVFIDSIRTIRLKKLSVAEAVQCRIVGRLMDYNLEGKSMEAGELIWSICVTLIQPSGT